MFVRALVFFHHLFGVVFWWYMLGLSRKIGERDPDDAVAGMVLLVMPLLLTSALIFVMALHRSLVQERWRDGLRTLFVLASPYLAGLPLLLLVLVRPSKRD